MDVDSFHRMDFHKVFGKKEGEFDTLLCWEDPRRQECRQDIKVCLAR
jgi:hypothetical protein